MKATRCATTVAAFVAMLVVGGPRAFADGLVEYVQNGSFETLSGPEQPADWSVTPHWTVNIGFAEDGTNSLSTNCSGPSVGCDANITQTLSDITGQTLAGSIWYVPGDFGPPTDLSVLINGVSVLNVSDAVSNSWLQETFSFTSTGSDLLEIDAWNFPATSWIDNVSVTGPGTSTPEPSAAGLMTVGALGLLFMLRKRRFLRTA